MSSVCREACKGHILGLHLAQLSRNHPDRNLASSSPSDPLSAPKAPTVSISQY